MDTGMKSIIIIIEEKDMITLKEEGYFLCIAGRDQDYDYGIIGFAEKQYFYRTTLFVGESYQLFFCKNVTKGEVVYPITPFTSVSLGQRVKIDKAGVVSILDWNGVPNAIEIMNDYGNLYPGITREIYVDGEKIYAPVFIAPYFSVKGSYTIVPTDKFIIWFEQCVENWQFIFGENRNNVSAGKSYELEVDFTEKNEFTIKFEEGNWKKI